MPLFSTFHFSFICLSLSAAHGHLARLCHPANVPPISSFLCLFSSLSHLIPTQSKHKTVWKIKCHLALLFPSPTCLRARPEGVVGFRVTGEGGWLNIKLSWELTLLLCSNLNAPLLLKPHPPPLFYASITLYPVNPRKYRHGHIHSTLPGRGHGGSFSSISFICRDKRGIKGQPNVLIVDSGAV